MYEGPAAAYLAAITVVTAEGQHSLAAITGGLIAAGVFVALLGAVGADRVIAKAFTPLVANVFVLTVTSALIPATVERAIGATGGLPGKAPAWAATIVVFTVAIALRRVPRLIPYSLLAALVAGTGVYVALAGAPPVKLGAGVAAPALLPWGTPRATIGVVIPFLLAGGLAAFNTVASGKVVSIAHGLPARPGAQRRSFLMHGAAQVGGATFGNVVGTVSRIDSIPIAQLLDHRGRAPLLLCGILVGALAFITPFVGVAAALPLSVSAALLAVLLSLILVHAAPRHRARAARAGGAGGGAGDDPDRGVDRGRHLPPANRAARGQPDAVGCPGGDGAGADRGATVGDDPSNGHELSRRGVARRRHRARGDRRGAGDARARRAARLASPSPSRRSRPAALTTWPPAGRWRRTLPERLAEFDAILAGPFGDPRVPDTVILWGTILALRQRFDQYVNLPPGPARCPACRARCRTLGSETFDVVVVRENTEGEYSGAGGRVHRGRRRRGRGRDGGVHPRGHRAHRSATRSSTRARTGAGA